MLGTKIQSTVEQRFKNRYEKSSIYDELYADWFPDDVIHFMKLEIQLAEQKAMEELMKKLYLSIQDDYIECTIDYFLKDQAEILGIKINS